MRRAGPGGRGSRGRGRRSAIIGPIWPAPAMTWRGVGADGAGLGESSCAMDASCAGCIATPSLASQGCMDARRGAACRYAAKTESCKAVLRRCKHGAWPAARAVDDRLGSGPGCSSRSRAAGQLAGAAGAARARRLGRLSRRIDRLEAELGVHLFEPHPRGARWATAAAEAMLAGGRGHGARAGASSRRRFDADSRTTAEGVVRLTAPPGVGRRVSSRPWLARFHQRFPRVAVELDASVGLRRPDAPRRRPGAGARCGPAQAATLIAVRVVSTQALPLTSPEYAAELGAAQAVERCALGSPTATSWRRFPTARWGHRARRCCRARAAHLVLPRPGPPPRWPASGSC